MGSAPRIVIALILTCALACGLTLGASQAATSTVIITASVASSTNLTASTCNSGTAGMTSFGTVLPGSPTVTTADCALTFGSSNNSAALRVSQADRSGTAMGRDPDGTLDTSWDGDGRVTDDIDAVAPDYAKGAVWEESTGKLLVLSAVETPNRNGAVTRFNSNGTVDGSYGVAGRRLLDPSGGVDDIFYGMVQNSDGTLWVYGFASPNGVIVKLTAGGALDTTFNGTGWKTYDPDSNPVTYDSMRALMPHPDGGYIATLDAANGVHTRLVRLTPTMDIDSTWNAGTGYVETTGALSECMVQVIEPNGGATCSGYVENSPTDQDTLFMRLLPDGRPDPAFGTNGVVTVSTGVNVKATTYSLVRMSDGRYVAGGYDQIGTGDSGMLIRLSSAGVPDPTFDGDGIRSFFLGGNPTVVDDLRLQDNGYILFVGRTMSGGGIVVTVGRLNSSLTLDTNFNGTGYRTFEFVVGDPTAQPGTLGGNDERIVVLGTRNVGASFASAMAVMSGDPVPDYAIGVTDWDQGSGMFGACLRVVGGGATGQWTTNATCSSTDGAYWNAVPAFPTKVAYTSAPTASATAGIRFGLRPRSTQTPSTYSSAVEFTVSAPNV